MDVYDRYLKMLDFTDEEIHEIRPQWLNACRLFVLSEEDLRFSMEDWIPQHWEISLHGVRQCIGAYIREAIEISRLPEYKARGNKILYSNVPTHPACIYANKLKGGNELHISHPEFQLSMVLGAFFNKKIFSSSAEAHCMNPLCHHCGLNKLKADAQYNGVITDPTVTWSWGLLCDEAPKVEEMIQCMGNERWPYVLTRNTHDAVQGLDEVENDERVDYLAEQIRNGQAGVSRYTGIEVTEEDVIAATEEYLEYSDKLEVLTNLVTNADPQPISGNSLTIFGALLSSAFNTGFSHINTAIDTMIEEVRELIRQGQGPLPANSPKLACHFIPYCVPWVDKTFRDNGVNLTVNTFFAPASTKREYYDKSNIYRSMAQQWLCSSSAVNMLNEAQIVSKILENKKVDGVLYGFFDFDRWLGSLQKIMIQIVEKETGIPSYYLEGDFWNDERYSVGSRVARIQSISYKVRINHMVNG